MDWADLSDQRSDAGIEGWERLGREVWPPLDCVEVAGFSCAYTHGYSKRANSALGIGPAAKAPPLASRVERVEAFYTERGLPAIFKLTAASPRGLEAHLTQRGYALVDPTSVCFRPSAPLSPGVLALPPADLNLCIDAAPRSEWLEAACRLNGVRADHAEWLEAIVGRISLPCAFASLVVDSSVLAVGLGVVSPEGALHLCEVACDISVRRAGLARYLVASLVAWGEARGVTQSWLQRVVANHPAAGLYAGLGFREFYRHWYRVSPTSGLSSGA